MTFFGCVRACATTPEFVANWVRLRGVSLPVSPLDLMIDEATGHDSVIAQQFIADVYDLVWSRLERTAKENP